MARSWFCPGYPDVVVTLTTGFIWGGVALLIMEKPGGGAPQQFLDLAAGTTLAPWLPNAVILLIAAVAVVWIPLKLGRAGLLVYAVGSDQGRGLPKRRRCRNYPHPGLYAFWTFQRHGWPCFDNDDRDRCSTCRCLLHAERSRGAGDRRGKLDGRQRWNFGTGIRRFCLDADSDRPHLPEHRSRTTGR